MYMVLLVRIVQPISEQPTPSSASQKAIIACYKGQSDFVASYANLPRGK